MRLNRFRDALAGSLVLVSLCSASIASSATLSFDATGVLTFSNVASVLDNDTVTARVTFVFDGTVSPTTQAGFFGPELNFSNALANLDLRIFDAIPGQTLQFIAGGFDVQIPEIPFSLFGADFLAITPRTETPGFSSQPVSGLTISTVSPFLNGVVAPVSGSASLDNGPLFRVLENFVNQGSGSDFTLQLEGSQGVLQFEFAPLASTLDIETSVIPEPAVLMLLGVGTGILTMRRHRHTEDADSL